MSLGTRIQLARKAKKMTQAELAKEIGVSTPSVISNWEVGVASPDPEKLARLCEILDVSGSYMLELSARNDENISESIPIDTDETLLLNIYRSLPMDLGEVLIQIGEHFLENVSSEKNNPIPFHITPNIHISYPLFLDKTDADYTTYRLNALKLKNTIKRSNIRETDIAKYLARIGYTDITLYDVVSIIRGTKVPNSDLYNNIVRYINGDIWISYRP